MGSKQQPYKTRNHKKSIHVKTASNAHIAAFILDVKVQTVFMSAFLTLSPLPPGRPGGPGSPGSPISPWGPCENKLKM